jgi:hypothetical protein
MSQIPSKAQTATKTVKANPSASLIGMKLSSPSNSISVNFRKGKANTMLCNEVEVKAANNTGRRLTLVFRDAAGQQIAERRVYKEWFEKMADQFGVDLP